MTQIVILKDQCAFIKILAKIFRNLENVLKIIWKCKRSRIVAIRLNMEGK